VPRFFRRVNGAKGTLFALSTAEQQRMSQFLHFSYVREFLFPARQ
jgi:hypothetical protein